MPFTSVFSSLSHVFDMLFLSVTSHSRLKLASEPRDYDQILKRTIREVKFFSETLLTILFFVETPALVSQTLACLMFSLITYVALESMSGDSLHQWINEIPFGRVVLALLTKLPALSVLWTLSLLALSQWDSLATKIVLCIVALVLFLGMAGRLRFHTLMKEISGKLWRYVMETTTKVLRSKFTFKSGLRGRKRKLSDASATSGTNGVADADVESVGNSDKYVDASSLSGDECV